MEAVRHGIPNPDRALCCCQVSSFAPSRGALYSFGSGVLLVALLMLGLWVLQVRQHHAVEELLMKQEPYHIASCAAGFSE